MPNYMFYEQAAVFVAVARDELAREAKQLKVHTTRARIVEITKLKPKQVQVALSFLVKQKRVEVADRIFDERGYSRRLLVSEHRYRLPRVLLIALTDWQDAPKVKRSGVRTSWARLAELDE